MPLREEIIKVVSKNYIALHNVISEVEMIEMENSEFISDEVADLLKRVKDQCEVKKRKYEEKK